jgi:3-oxoacyl-[acyl-carrier protein] reductase
MELEGKIAIVTGGAAGIGKAIATALTEQGASVAIADVREDLALETASGLEAQGLSAAAFPVDVSNSTQVEAMVQAVTDQLGQIDILVNDAGIGQSCSFLEMAEDEWERVMAINLKGAFLCAQAVARRMVERSAGGRIVSIVSTAASNARTDAAAYCASKAGLLQLTKVMALELGPHGITVNAVGPGLTITGSPVRQKPTDAYRTAFVAAVPLGRTGQPTDIAQAVAFLASPRADYISGQVIYVDGGYSAGKLSVRE